MSDYRERGDSVGKAVSMKRHYEATHSDNKTVDEALFHDKVLKKGDTLWDITNGNQTAIEMIADRNHIKDQNKIYAGETIGIIDKELADVSKTLRKNVTGISDVTLEPRPQCTHNAKGMPSSSCER